MATWTLIHSYINYAIIPNIGHIKQNGVRYCRKTHCTSHGRSTTLRIFNAQLTAKWELFNIKFCKELFPLINILKCVILHDDKCYFFQKDVETIEHLFSFCPIVKDFWIRQHSESQEWSTKFYFVKQQYYNTVHTQLATLINFAALYV